MTFGQILGAFLIVCGIAFCIGFGANCVMWLLDKAFKKSFAFSIIEIIILRNAIIRAFISLTLCEGFIPLNYKNKEQTLDCIITLSYLEDAINILEKEFFEKTGTKNNFLQ